MNRSDIPQKFLSWNGILKIWHDWLDENDISALQASLAFPLSFPEIDRVVVGADSQGQLLEIINATINISNTELPNLVCSDENLINPTNWSKL
jgi:aryl-alcohol dehydrogenase-like predicted oxidoreductase